MTQSPIGLLGLGLMGFEIAQRLISSGYRVLGTDIDPARCGLATTIGVECHQDPAAVWSQCDRVLLSLPTHTIVESVIDQAQLRAGTLIVDTTTGSPQSTEAVASRMHDRQVEVIDATISGSSAQLRAGTAVIIAGATEEAWLRSSQIVHSLSPHCFHVGPPGAGARMKLVTNLVLGLNRAALAEGLAYADAQGLDLSLTLKLLKSTPAYSRMMDTKGEKMIERDFTPQAKLSQHLKDVNLIIECAASHNLSLPLSQAHRQLLGAAQKLGLGDMDNSALIAAYDRK